jgi:hypothetical protein
MWLFDFLAGRRSLWRQVTDQRLRNQQTDLLRIEQKLDDIDFRLHRTLGEHCGRMDDQSIMVGQLASEVSREGKHLDMTVRAAELTVCAVKELRSRIDQVEQQLAQRPVAEWAPPITD